MQLIRTPSSTRKKMKSSTNGTPAKLLQSPPPYASEFSQSLPQFPLPALPNRKCKKKATGNAINLRRQSPYLRNLTTPNYWANLRVNSRCQFNGNEPVTAVSPRAMWLYALGHPSAQIGTTRSGALGVPPESVPARWYFLPESAARKW